MVNAHISRLTRKTLNTYVATHGKAAAQDIQFQRLKPFLRTAKGLSTIAGEKHKHRLYKQRFPTLEDQLANIRNDTTLNQTTKSFASDLLRTVASAYEVRQARRESRKAQSPVMDAYVPAPLAAPVLPALLEDASVEAVTPATQSRTSRIGNYFGGIKHSSRRSSGPHCLGLGSHGGHPSKLHNAVHEGKAGKHD
ncbi:MAG: hypothetical protein HC945_02965 [Nitrosarchaeum sp.]|nr:hypothetical protein [Nitrosarchaeum sp.]